MNGAEYIAEFFSQIGSKKVFVVTGGACAFIIDAIARNKELDYYPSNMSKQLQWQQIRFGKLIKQLELQL